jgi:hypothetical protein
MKQYIDGFVKSRIFPFSGFPPSREGQKGNKNKIDTIGVIPAKAGIQVVLWLFTIFSNILTYAKNWLGQYLIRIFCISIEIFFTKPEFLPAILMIS